MEVCCAGVRDSAAATSGTPLTTMPLSKRHVNAIHSAFLCWYRKTPVDWNAWSWSMRNTPGARAAP